jgi:hypothetical protein
MSELAPLVRIRINSFWIQKDGNSPSEYEDAYWPDVVGELAGGELRFAVTDGASESFLSGQWARILARSYCLADTAPVRHRDVVDRASRRWKRWKHWYLTGRERSRRPIQWYEEPGLEAGAFSSLVGLSLFPRFRNRPGRWRALAVGDSCMFQMRGEKLLKCFPLVHSADFTNSPALVASNPRYRTAAVRTASGSWRAGDRFYLMTDALASWFIRESEQGKCPWSTLRGFRTSDRPGDFSAWVQDLRRDRDIRNDDVTFLRIDLI